ncbi:hypothetical protein AmaxDRAFT_4799 [Limnospira maxima CS-328]|uniref:Uncharacterized protein n=2 Tax=Sirenicapillariaceae TaxID=2934961 RepID=B5W7P9_LIMMA|nr:hypothetical protein AmaxDRAFT_4799 [Limnospira maxima CS-328]
MSAGELLRQANQLKRSGRLDEAIALHQSPPTTTLARITEIQGNGDEVRSPFGKQPQPPQADYSLAVCFLD